MTTAKVTRRGTSENPIFDFDLPQGAKGEPGNPLNLTLAGTGDLNDLLTPAALNVGVAISTFARNYPVEGVAGALFSYERSTSGLQEFWPTSSAQMGNMFYRRIRVNHAWQPWRSFSSQRVDNTAGRAIYTWDDTWNREQMIYGDTGLRNISANLLGIQPPTGNTFPSIRRVGTTVTLNLNGIVIDQDYAGQLELYVVPDGFKNSFQQINMYPIVRTSPLEVKTMQLVSQKYVRLYQDPKAGDQIRHQITWETTDPWPTTLPGIAA